jgi:hypothetical protein
MCSLNLIHIWCYKRERYKHREHTSTQWVNEASETGGKMASMRACAHAGVAQQNDKMSRQRMAVRRCRSDTYQCTRNESARRVDGSGRWRRSKTLHAKHCVRAHAWVVQLYYFWVICLGLAIGAHWDCLVLFPFWVKGTVSGWDYKWNNMSAS